VSPTGRPTVLCIATYEKGQEFLRECKRLGCRVLLVTDEKLRDADWPRESIDDTFYIPRGRLSREDLLKGVSHLARTESIDRVVPLDDFDVEVAALIREHLRVAGMGETTARYFRDKLAMRVRAHERGILVPEFVAVVNSAAINGFAGTVPPPWVLKPRMQAAAIGIRKIATRDELWPAIDALGDEHSFYLLERFVAGDVYHAHRYRQPPWDVAHQGGIFATQTLPDDSPEASAVGTGLRDVVSSLGLVHGVTHTEFIRSSADGRLFFLETSARVGGAHIVDLVEAATGVNLWREWARLEVAGERGHYQAPEGRRQYAGIVLSLARQEWPDTSAYVDPEIVLRITRAHHAGLIVASDDHERVETLLDQYARRFAHDFMASLPAPDRPSS
jgi:biotin carboxylase